MLEMRGRNSKVSYGFPENLPRVEGECVCRLLRNPGFLVDLAQGEGGNRMFPARPLRKLEAKAVAHILARR